MWTKVSLISLLLLAVVIVAATPGLSTDENDGGDEHAVCPPLMATANEDGTITVTAEGLITTATLMRHHGDPDA